MTYNVACFEPIMSEIFRRLTNSMHAFNKYSGALIKKKYACSNKCMMHSLCSVNKVHNKCIRENQINMVKVRLKLAMQ